ncbi:male sterility protein-domain-containing protein [Nemania diffusa]|nr:male sterility protein-domain-containing protein [Nemania diffusa]
MPSETDYEFTKTLSDKELLGMRGHRLGLDSLISVDLRTWFMKALMVNMPVLRIMSDDTMASLVQEAMIHLPSSLVPGVPALITRSQNNGYGSNIHLGVLTSRQSSNADVATADSESLKQTRINWDFETAPPVPRSDLTLDLNRFPQLPPRVIVLTGATGLLGNHLLNEILIRTPTSTRIICIAMRKLMTMGTENALTLFRHDALLSENLHRVSFYPGDLLKPQLGLTDNCCNSIFTEADAVIHNAADTSHMKPYGSIRQANLGATTELVRLCLPRRIPFHFVSSPGVGLFADNENMTLYPKQAPGMPQSPSHIGKACDTRLTDIESRGYMASKWACERLLERTNKDHGLPVWIHRPSTILCEGSDAEGERASLDWLHGLARYARILKAVPRIMHVTGALDMVHVQTVCSILVDSVLRSTKSESRSGVEYVHEVGDIVVPLDRLELLIPALEAGRMNKDSGTLDSSSKGCKVVPMGEWVGKAIEAGLHPAVAMLIEKMDAPDSPAFPLLEKTLK